VPTEMSALGVAMAERVDKVLDSMIQVVETRTASLPGGARCCLAGAGVEAARSDRENGTGCNF
jgi:hypothetical protein